MKNEKGDLPQAGEKYYNAVAELIKAIAEKRAKEAKDEEEKNWYLRNHKSHIGRNEIILKLQKDYPKLDLLGPYDMVNIFHQNFYENFLTQEQFESRKERIESLICHLKKILEEPCEDKKSTD